MIIVRIWEGLGNQMFQYAFAKSLELKTGKSVYIECDKAYNESLPHAGISNIKRDYKLDNFQITLKKIDLEKEKSWAFLKQDSALRRFLFLCSCYLGFPKKVVIQKNDASTQVKQSWYHYDNCFFMGWYQNEKILRPIRKQLLKEFTPRKRIKISKELRNLIESENVVSIHVRRTDYVKAGTSLPNGYYEKAIEQIKTRVENPVFLIFSDDLQWSRNHIAKNEDRHFISDYGMFQDFEELLIMSRCKNNIIANSSFSWWAAWLNRNTEKNVIMPKVWFGYQSTREKQVPDGWIEI